MAEAQQMHLRSRRRQQGPACSSRQIRRRRRHPKATASAAPPAPSVVLLAVLALLLALAIRVAPVNADDDLLAEILAEEEAREAEHAELEAEGREYEAARARQYSESGQQQQQQQGGGGRNKKSMPAGANVNFGDLEEEIRRKEEEAAAATAADRAAREEAEAAEIAERHRAEREAKFEADVARMNAEQRKAALRQKKRDARVVNRVLKAARSNPPRHYAVLGIRNWDVKIGPFHLFKVGTKDVKRAYRNLSRRVHPDKNRDGRAEEAFHALEASAAELSDPDKKSAYDRSVASRRRKRRGQVVGGALDTVEFGRRNVAMVVGAVNRVLGPFSTPIFVLGALII